MSVEGINYYQNNYRIQAQKRANHSACRNNKKEKMPIERKIGIASLGVLAALWLLKFGSLSYLKKDYIKPEKLPKSLSDVFKRDISVEQTKEIQNKYKELYKIKDAEEFTRKIYEQIKKDYGYENADIPLKINYKGKYFFLKQLLKGKRHNTLGCANSFNPSITINLSAAKGDKLGTFAKKNITDIIFHEFKHIQQFELCYRHNKNKFFETIPEYSEFPTMIKLNYERAFQNVPIKNTKNEAGTIEKYIYNLRNYKSSSSEYSKYKNQIVEQEAFAAGNTGRQLTNTADKNPYALRYGPVTKGLAGISLGCFAIDGYKNYTKNNN